MTFVERMSRAPDDGLGLGLAPEPTIGRYLGELALSIVAFLAVGGLIVSLGWCLGLG
jgi:hypothetical protein